tara:strand:- start:181 stop:504 length:324 start_codon:yes stop_codon:yes gene_type:complete
LASGVIIFEYYVRSEISYTSANTLLPTQIYLCCFAFCCLLCGKEKYKHKPNVSSSEIASISKSEGVLDVSDLETPIKSQLVFDPLSKHPTESKFQCTGPATRQGNFL